MSPVLEQVPIIMIFTNKTTTFFYFDRQRF